MATSRETRYVNEIRYVNKVSDDGWINGRDSASALIPMCMYTKVSLQVSKDGRTSFKVLDGTHAGKVLSMKDENAALHLGKMPPASGGISVVITYGKYVENWVSIARGGQKLDQQFATLTVGTLSAKVTMNTVWGREFFPLPAGRYTILLPDVPHDGGMTTFYRNVEPTLKHDQVWFPIQYGDNSRYVHVGNVSDGCSTVVDLYQWASICNTLISHRTRDGKSVGSLTVKGKPERAK